MWPDVHMKLHWSGYWTRKFVYCECGLMFIGSYTGLDIGQGKFVHCECGLMFI